MTNLNENVRYIHLKPTNITFKFVLEDGKWVCRTTDEFLNDAVNRLNTLQDDLR